MPIDYNALERAKREHPGAVLVQEEPMVRLEILKAPPKFDKPRAPEGLWSDKLTHLRARRERIEAIAIENDVRIAKAIREAKEDGATLRQIAPILGVSAQGVNHIVATDAKRRRNKEWEKRR